MPAQSLASARDPSQEQVRALVTPFTEARPFGTLRVGEPRVNVLELNLALDALRQVGVSGQYA